MGIMRNRVIVLALGSCAALALSGCDENGQFVGGNGATAQSGTDPAAASVKGGKTIERDIEAPDVFSATEAGLWDGRPSLGGVWVAHPDVTDPERVIIRNSDNGKFVVGALFRREREIPGPRLQISSDAAASLGMLAGAPSTLNVTALRREEIEVEAPAPVAVAAAEPTPEPEPKQVETVAEAPKVEAATLDPIETASAAIDAAPETPLEAPVVEKPKRKWSLFKRKAAEPETLTAEAAGVDTSVAVQPLDAASTAGLTTAAAAAAPAPKPVAKPTPKTSRLSKPFLQVGIFSVEANATRTAAQMRAAGMVPSIRRGETNGKPFWRVIVGPAITASEQKTLLTKIKGIGFSDAYAVRG